MGVMQKQED